MPTFKQDFSQTEGRGHLREPMSFACLCNMFKFATVGCYVYTAHIPQTISPRKEVGVDLSLLTENLTQGYTEKRKINVVQIFKSLNR